MHAQIGYTHSRHTAPPHRVNPYPPCTAHAVYSVYASQDILNIRKNIQTIFVQFNLKTKCQTSRAKLFINAFHNDFGSDIRPLNMVYTSERIPLQWEHHGAVLSIRQFNRS